MAITIRFFAQLKEESGVETKTLAWKNFATASDVMDEIERRFPQLEKYRHVISLAKNGEYIQPREPVQDGDEIAFIPPIAGGSNG